MLAVVQAHPKLIKRKISYSQKKKNCIYHPIGKKIYFPTHAELCIKSV